MRRMLVRLSALVAAVAIVAFASAATAVLASHSATVACVPDSSCVLFKTKETGVTVERVNLDSRRVVELTIRTDQEPGGHFVTGTCVTQFRLATEVTTDPAGTTRVRIHCKPHITGTWHDDT